MLPPWQSFGKEIVTFLFCGMSICSILVGTVPSLRSIGTHGKRIGSGNNGDNNSCNSYHQLQMIHELLQVPKSLFGWMYVYGALTGAVCLTRYCQNVNAGCWQSLLCYELHCIRRLFECYFMADFGSSTMHIAGLVVGLVHYTLVPLCLLLAGDDNDDQAMSWFHIQSLGNVRVVQLLSMTLYMAASALQFHSHAVLFSIKRKGPLMKSFTPHYEFPCGGGFEYVACPHYLAEILIYFSWILPLPFVSSMLLWSMVMWVASNLAVVADSQYRWYGEHFPVQFKHQVNQGWKRLFPKVW